MTNRDRIDRDAEESHSMLPQNSYKDLQTVKNGDIKNPKRLSIKKNTKKANTKSVLTIQTNKSITNFNSAV